MVGGILHRQNRNGFFVVRILADTTDGSINALLPLDHVDGNGQLLLQNLKVAIESDS